MARPHLFTSGDYRARAAGAVSPAHHVRIVRPLLRQGTTGDGVRSLVQRLAELGL